MMPPLVERSPARARPPKSQERCHLILSHLPWTWQCGAEGGESCVVSNGQIWGFSHIVMYVDTCTRSLPAPEPHRSSPKREVSDVPTAKGLSRWSEQSSLPMHVYLSLLTLTLALLRFGFLSSLSSYSAVAVTFLILNSMPLPAR